MKANDRFQMRRAEQARHWLAHPDRELERVIDINERRALDIKLGHSPQCGLIKCHKNCKQYK